MIFIIAINNGAFQYTRGHMGEVLSYFPGQVAVIWLQVLDGYDGYRVDPITTPMVNRIIYPNLGLPSGFPQAMTRFDVGLYFFQFQLPTGAAGLGNYLVDVSYPNFLTGITNFKIYQLIVTAPYGNFGTATVG